MFLKRPIQSNCRKRVHRNNHKTESVHAQSSSEDFKGFNKFDIINSKRNIFKVKSGLDRAQSSVSLCNPNRHTGITQTETPNDRTNFKGNQLQIGVGLGTSSKRLIYHNSSFIFIRKISYLQNHSATFFTGENFVYQIKLSSKQSIV